MSAPLSSGLSLRHEAGLIGLEDSAVAALRADGDSTTLGDSTIRDISGRQIATAGCVSIGDIETAEWAVRMNASSALGRRTGPAMAA